MINTAKEKKSELEQLRFQAKNAERDADYNQVAEIRYNQIPKIEKEIQEANKALSSLQNRLLEEEVNRDLIAEIVSKWTGIPVKRMLKTEQTRLLDLENILEKNVVGQPIAIKAVSEAIRRSRSGLADPNRPIGAFLFVGPTGVGKTELAKTLAKELFDTEEAMIRLDMSEYMEKHSVSKLIGSPPGYVGYDEGGQLTEAIRRRPYSVVLLDEVEKAHHDVFNILLQIFDDGRITDSKGRCVNCKNALFIMTSNLGSTELLENPTQDKDKLLSLIDPIIKTHFRPEFINRLDEILPFMPLQNQDMEKIASIQLDALQKRLSERHNTLNVSKELLRHLALIGYDPVFGARPLKRLIQKEITNLLSNGILKGEIKEGCKIDLKIRDDKPAFDVA